MSHREGEGAGRRRFDADSALAAEPGGPQGQAHGGHAHGGHAHGGHAHGDAELGLAWSVGLGSALGAANAGTAHPGHGYPAYLGFVAAPQALRAKDGIPERGKTLFLDCQSGVAGDMCIAALLDLGVPMHVLESSIAALGLGEVGLKVRSGYVGALGCTHFDVIPPPGQGERNYYEIVNLLERAPLEDKVRSLALRIFHRLGTAEAEVHRTTLEHVHFHEVGAIDAIVDIVGAAALFSWLDARVLVSSVPLGTGYVECRHGVLPLPAPAALLCLRGLESHASGLDVELVTPTGAAILAEVQCGQVSWPSFRPERVGYGAGTRGLPDRPNVLRAVLGTVPVEQTEKALLILEANLDDLSPEQIAFAAERLLELGALDTWVAPVQMKKGRSGHIISCLAELMDAQRLTEAMFRETSTLGVRQTLVSRKEVPRSIESLESPLGSFRVKFAPTLGRYKIEFEDVRDISRRTGHSYAEVLAVLDSIARKRCLPLDK